MFVASCVGPGTSAGRPRFPKSLALFELAIGCASLTRASGIAAQIMVDPVCQGDVIETTSRRADRNSLSDGTVFQPVPQRPPGAEQFVCDSRAARNRLCAG